MQHINSGENVHWDIQAGSLAVVPQSSDPSVVLTPAGGGGSWRSLAAACLHGGPYCNVRFLYSKLIFKESEKDVIR